MTTRRTKKSAATRFLEELSGEVLTFGGLLLAIREGENTSQAEFARRLGVSRAHLCDLEKGRRMVSVRRAADFAEILGYDAASFVRLAIQDMLAQEDLPFSVSIDAA